ncbi:histone-lysine N-methyltransferase setd3 [Selaginella moellendorffii]|nr:histone-lysine N-methyltransferase setd3 [Selaginella moellendorffii]|eukprot:XP_002964620.2 histone-lysine N-methyltransferase setd3 [Selaginella moellendorffii]
MAPGARARMPVHGARRWSSAASAFAASVDLRGWVKNQGGFVWSGLHVVHSGSSHGMGLVATQDLPQGSTIITLPRRVPMPMPDPENAAVLAPSEGVICEIANRVPEELWAMRLGLKLLYERAQKGSYWWPYISMLPHSFTLPIFFSGVDIESIDYAPVTHQVKKRCRFLLQFSAELAKLESLPEEVHPFAGQSVDSGALGWAMAAVSSRAFRIHGVTNKLCSAMMLPLIDMCNHSFQPNAHIEEDLSRDAQDVSFLKVVTKRNLEKGSAITLNYGPLSNDLLLLDYGFVIPDNPHDRIELRYDGSLMENARMIAGLSRTGSPPFSSPASWQVDRLKQLGLADSGESQKVTLGGPEEVDGRLLAALRILHAESQEPLERRELVSLQAWGVESMVSSDNEERVLRTLCGLAAIVFNQFKTTIEEDEAKLSDKSLAETSRIAVQFRLTKKRLVVRVLESLKKRLMDLRAVRAEFQ